MEEFVDVRVTLVVVKGGSLDREEEELVFLVIEVVVLSCVSASGSSVETVMVGNAVAVFVTVAKICGGYVSVEIRGPR